MSIVDILIIIVLILFSIIGFNRGVFKSLVVFLGFIAVIVLSYMFKNTVGDFFVLNLPFFDFGKSFMGVSTLNIIVYQAIALVIMLIIFGLIYKFLVTITGIFEKVLKMTIILGLPSKLLGMVFGFLEGYIVVYVALFILSQPFINFNLINDSKYTSIILKNSPIISKYAENSVHLLDEVNELSSIEDANTKDLMLSRIILKRKVTSADVMQKLVDTGKIDIEGIDDVINEYRLK